MSVRMSRAVLATVVLAALYASPVWADQASLVIESATVVSPQLDAPLEGMSIIVEGETIVAVVPTDAFDPPTGARIVDGRGKWAIPGIVELHSHETAPAALRRALALGVTTAQTIGRPDSSGVSEAASIHPMTTTPRLVLVSGFVGEFAERMGLDEVRTPQTATEARANVLAWHRSGVRRVKVWQDDGSLWFGQERQFPPVAAPVLDELVRAAHTQNMQVVLHAWTLPFLRQGLDAGVDGIIHPVADSIVPTNLWRRVREDNLVWTTTMAVILIYGDPKAYATRVLSDRHLAASLSSDQKSRLTRDSQATTFPTDTIMPTLHLSRDQYMEMVRQNTLAARTNDVPLVVGSDAPPGVGTHIELELMAEAGISPADLLMAATHNGATALDLGAQLGTLEPGKRADIVLLNADPLADVRNWRDIHRVVKGGQLYLPPELIVGANN